MQVQVSVAESEAASTWSSVVESKISAARVFVQIAFASSNILLLAVVYQPAKG